MEFFIKATVLVCVFFALYMTYRAWRKENLLQGIINRWRKNPTKMDLSLATTKQIVKELQSRSQPIIMVLPDMPKVEGQPVKSVQLYVLGIDPYHARMLLHGAGELLSNGSLPTVDEE